MPEDMSKHYDPKRVDELVTFQDVNVTAKSHQLPHVLHVHHQDIATYVC